MTQTLARAFWTIAFQNSAFCDDANVWPGRDARSDRKLTAARTAHHFLFASRHQSNWTALKAGVWHAWPKGHMRPSGSLCASQIYGTTHNKSEGLFYFKQTIMLLFTDQQRSAGFAIRGWWRAAYVSRDGDVVKREVEWGGHMSLLLLKILNVKSFSNVK